MTAQQPESWEAWTWLNDPEVRSALHAAPADVTGDWSLCSTKIHYTHDAGSMLPVHTELIQVHGLRALVYSGDADMCVPVTGSEAWTSRLGYPVSAPWAPWLVDDDQVAGFAVEYLGERSEWVLRLAVVQYQ